MWVRVWVWHWRRFKFSFGYLMKNCVIGHFQAEEQFDKLLLELEVAHFSPHGSEITVQENPTLIPYCIWCSSYRYAQTQYVNWISIERATFIAIANILTWVQ